MPQTAARLEVIAPQKEKKTARLVIAGLAVVLAAGGAIGWAMYAQWVRIH